MKKSRKLLTFAPFLAAAGLAVTACQKTPGTVYAPPEEPSSARTGGTASQAGTTFDPFDPSGTFDPARESETVEDIYGPPVFFGEEEDEDREDPQENGQDVTGEKGDAAGPEEDGGSVTEESADPEESEIIPATLYGPPVEMSR